MIERPEIVCDDVKGAGGNVLLPRPDWLPDGERVNGVPVDGCMAPAVVALWEAGFRTLGSCCGHNERLPSIVLTNDRLSVAEVRRLHAVVAEHDPRRWTVHQWQLITLPQPRMTQGDT